MKFLYQVKKLQPTSPISMSYCFFISNNYYKSLKEFNNLNESFNKAIKCI